MIKELTIVGAKEASSGKGYFMGDFTGLETSIKDSKRFKVEPVSRMSGLALRPIWPMGSAIGSGLAAVMFLTTISFLFTTPGWETLQESTRFDPRGVFNTVWRQENRNWPKASEAGSFDRQTDPLEPACQKVIVIQPDDRT